MNADPHSASVPHELTGKVIGLAMRVHQTLGPGFLEVIYRNALCLEMAESALDFASEQELTVRYRNHVVGNYRADLVVSSVLLVEIKAVQSLVPAHEVQLVNYLRATNLSTGLLLNFGSRSLEFKRRLQAIPDRNSPDLQA